MANCAITGIIVSTLCFLSCLGDTTSPWASVTPPRTSSTPPDITISLPVTSLVIASLPATLQSFPLSFNTSASNCSTNQYLVEGECLACGCARRQACNNQTGRCPQDKCRKWRYGKACVYGILVITNDRANPREGTNATCYIQTSPQAEFNSSNVYLTTESNPKTLLKPIETVKVKANHIGVVFFVESGFDENELVTCHIKLGDGQVLSKRAATDLYRLPILTRPLELFPLSSAFRYLQLIIPRWDLVEGDGGEGPVEHYKIQVCRYTESQNCSDRSQSAYKYVLEIPDFPSARSPITINRQFKPGAKYSFVYKARRPGRNGYGSPSPLLNVKMPCKRPTVEPEIHSHNYTMNLIDSNIEFKTVNFTISWELPHGDSSHSCDYISDVTVGVAMTSCETNETACIRTESVVSANVTTMTTTLEPYTDYTVSISYTNNAGLVSDANTLRINRTLQAPPSRARITKVYMNDESSVKVHWEPPEYPYGEITKYEVLYLYLPETGNLQQAPIPGCEVHPELDPTNSCVVNDLQLGRNWSFLIRPRNRAGFPDESLIRAELWIYETELSVPDPITTLANVSKTETSILLTWSAPENTGGLNITTYILKCTTGDYTVVYGVTPQADGSQTSKVATLNPGTQYTCHVTAQNMKGESSVTQQLKVYTDPAEPSAPSMPVFMDDLNTDTSIALKITAGGRKCCSLYRIVVMKMNAKVKREVDEMKEDSDVDSCGKCCNGGCYIAGQFDKDKLPSLFTVGDNKSYSGYYNPPLVTGESYQILYGAGNSAGGVNRFKYTPLAQPVVVKEYLREKQHVMSSASLIGIIVGGVCVSAVIMILLVMVFVRHKRNKMFQFRTPDSEKVIELNENGTLLPNGTYQRGMYRQLDGDAVSVDSLDLSKQPNGEPVYDNVRLKQYPVMVEELRQYIEQKSSDDGFKREYNRIPWGLKFSHEVAKRPDNKHKNRYGNIIAYDHSRVILKGKHPEQDTDYINASYIDGYKTPKEYIATQGPTKFTVNDLWHMAWQEGTAIIVMVTNTIEQTRHKCEQYWPEEGAMQCANIKVTLSHTKSLAHYKIRTFTMEQDDEIRHIKQFHFTAWPDHGTPTHATTLLSFLKKVRQQKSDDDGPIICHCSAGVGRSGTFIALDSLLQQAESEGKVDVYGYVTQMRKQRCNMIQTLDQYIFLHDAILEASEGFDTTISLSDFKLEFDSIRHKQSKGKSQLEIQYQKLQELLYVDRSTDASSKENKAKNRCANVIPFNERRVLLVNMLSNYINATYVDDHRKRCAIIATQHPLVSTIEDFWKMIEIRKPFAIVTLCASSAVDVCSTKQDLPKFWPTPECRTEEFTTISVELLDEATLDQIPAVTKQALTISCKNQTMFQSKPTDVDHYMCDFWQSQKSLPSDKESFVKLVTMLERRKQENDDRPIVVNCFDGAKQTGLYLACHSLLQQILMDSEVDIPETVKLIRNDQPMFIPDVGQFQFCYEFISEYLDSSNQDSAVFTHL